MEDEIIDQEPEVEIVEEPLKNKKTKFKHKRKNYTFKEFMEMFWKKTEKLPKPFVITVIAILYSLLVFAFFYFGLPTLHVNTISSWLFIGILLVLIPLSFVIFMLGNKIKKINNKYLNKPGSLCSIITIVYIAILVIGGLSSAKIFTSKSYAGLLETEVVSTTDDNMHHFHHTFDYDRGNVQLPTIDKEIAYRLAQTKLGSYGDQYQITDKYFSIQCVHNNGVDTLVRVVPLEYANLFVSLGNMNIGTPGYIEVNVITGEANLVQVEGGIKYLDSGKFEKDLNRHIRFYDPTLMVSEKYFEIDDNGNPYWVVPCHDIKVGLFGGRDPSCVLIINPVNGRIDKYSINNAPGWVDHVVSSEVMIEQANDYLRYRNGFINATIGSKENVFSLSDGYNYFINDDHSYFVSTITSQNENDQTSIGFITIDLKSGESVIYNSEELQGLTEMRAREICMQEDSVKAQKFEATWPILISYKGHPTYFLTLKNSVTVQKYCFIDIQTGLNVAIESTLQSAQAKYLSLLNEIPDNHITVSGTIYRANIVGDYIYFSLKEHSLNLTGDVYKAPLTLDPKLYLLDTDDKVVVVYSIIDGECIVNDITITSFAEDSGTTGTE